MDHPIARRTVIAGAGAGLAASLVGEASAQSKPDIQASEYWTSKGETKLYLYRKRAAPKPGEPQPVVFLVHGSSNSSRSSYDLSVPGKGEYSFMNVLAGYGFDVWTMDHDGYGRSGSSGNNSDIASGVADLKAAIPVVVQETGQQKLHMYGTSSGAIRAGAYAQAAPERVDRLILSAFTYKGTGSPEIARRNAVADRYRNSPRRKRDLAMIRSIFTRDGHASAYDMAVADAIAADELKFGDQVPTGTYLDMAVNLPLVDPTKVQSPGADDPRRARRQLDQRGSARFLRAARERRPPVRDPAAHRALDRLQQQPAPVVVRGAEFPECAGGGGVLTPAPQPT